MVKKQGQEENTVFSSNRDNLEKKYQVSVFTQDLKGNY